MTIAATFSASGPGTWLSRRGITGTDVLVSLALLLLGQFEVAVNGVAGDALLAHLFWAAVALTALVRRIHPVWFALICVPSLYVRVDFDLSPEFGAIGPITTPLAIFGLGMYARGSGRSAVLAIGAALLAIAMLVWFEYGPPEIVTNGFSWQWLRTVTLYLGAAVAGIYLRDRSDRLAEVEARVEAMPPPESAVATELAEARTGIAREVHAVVERCLDEISAAIHQAREMLPGDPSQALGATRRARHGSREAMDEMRRMLGLLRADPASPDTQPTDLGQGRSPWRAIGEFLRDQLLILVLLINGILNAFFTYADADVIGGDLSLGLRLLAAVVTALLFIPRRRWPVFTAASVAVVLFVRVVWLDDRFPLDIFVWAAVFVAGAYTPRLVAGTIAALFVLVCSIAIARIEEPMTPFMAYVAFSTTTIAAWMVGIGCRDRVTQTTEIEALEREEKERRRDISARAIRTERLGLAREMHDLIGHGLTSITLQCAVVERVILDDPDGADLTLKTIETLTTEVRSELGTLLGALSGVREPALPELATLGDLVERTRSGGQPVRLEAIGDLDSVPIGPSAAAYRIVQESLANASKYAGRGEVRARVERLEDRVSIEVDNPVGNATESVGYGFGLAGMRERAETYGGSFEAGPAGSGGWRVQAEVPLSPTEISPLS